MQLELIKQYNIDHGMRVNLAKYVIGTTAILSTIYILRKIFKRLKHIKRIEKKRKEVNDRKICLLQKLEGMVLPLNNIKKLCHLSGTELLTKINSGEVAPVDILEAYQANALLNNNEINFIADIIYDADVSSLLINRDKQQTLMGWPLSIKDTFCVEKYDCTQGLPSKIFQPCSKNSVVIQALKNEGAIPFIITNVCQGLQVMELSNPIFGKTVNPFNHKMTCGGSSGGEGASLGSQSSLIGIGNDAGGSIIIPASYCGIYGFKPTSSRVSSRHTDRIYYCDLIINISIGPMARYIDDLIITFKAMTSERVFKMDPYVPPIPFNEALLLSKSKMKIGFYTHIGGCCTNTVPAVDRAVMMAKASLESAGHEVVEFNLPNIDYIFDLIWKVFILDGGKKLLKEGLQDCPIDPSLRNTVRMLKTSKFVKYILSFFCSIFNKSLSKSILASAGSTVFETWKLKDDLIQYREEVLSMLEKENIEGIICPVLPIVAPPLDTSNSLTGIDIYCSIYNILDYPRGSVPVTFVTEVDLKNLNNIYPIKINKNIIKLQKESLGLPVGVQCVSLPWRDETCLRIMKEVSLNL